MRLLLDQKCIDLERSSGSCGVTSRSGHGFGEGDGACGDFYYSALLSRMGWGNGSGSGWGAPDGSGEGSGFAGDGGHGRGTGHGAGFPDGTGCD